MSIKGLAEIKVLASRGDASDACLRFFNRLQQIPPRSTIHLKTKTRNFFVQELFSIKGSVMQTDKGPIDLTHVDCVYVYTQERGDKRYEDIS